MDAHKNNARVWLLLVLVRSQLVLLFALVVQITKYKHQSFPLMQAGDVYCMQRMCIMLVTQFVFSVFSGLCGQPAPAPPSNASIIQSPSRAAGKFWIMIFDVPSAAVVTVTAIVVCRVQDTMPVTQRISFLVQFDMVRRVFVDIWYKKEGRRRFSVLVRRPKKYCTSNVYYCIAKKK